MRYAIQSDASGKISSMDIFVDGLGSVHIGAERLVSNGDTVVDMYVETTNVADILVSPTSNHGMTIRFHRAAPDGVANEMPEPKRR